MSRIVNLFFCHIPSSRYVFPDGTEAAFIAGRYATDDEDKIAHLNYEISKGHQHIFTDPEKLQCDEAELDPMEALKKKIIEDYVAQQAANALTESTSIQSALKPSSSAELTDVKTPEEVILGKSIPAIVLPAK